MDGWKLMDKISVFGSTGFIGKRFCELYPDSIIKISREDVVPKSNNVLYLISTTHNYHVFTDPYLDINTNLLHFIKVLKQFKVLYEFDKNAIFTLISTWFSIAGCDIPAKEEYIGRPRGFYGITAWCRERLLIDYCNTFGLNYKILRLANVFGEGDKPNGKKNALQYLILDILKNEDVFLYHGGDVIRDYIFVDDVCMATNLCMSKGNSNTIYHIGNGIPYKFGELIQIAKNSSGYQKRLNSIPPSDFHKKIQVKDFYMDISKIKQLGYETTTDVCNWIPVWIEKLKNATL
jgi:nucleoside-diphosphate-sugar epimerase